MVKGPFRLSRVSGQPVSDDELLHDLRRVADHLEKPTVGQQEYRRLGRYDDSTITRRFGSWNSGLLAAGLTVSNTVNITDDQLFENILVLWQHYGRQPRRRELASPPSTISQSPYLRRFRSWTAALQSFVAYANTAEPTLAPAIGDRSSTRCARRTPRDPSLRLRFQVLQRDGFACRACGASPASQAGTELQVDHIVPWSKGGETVASNLQTLCRDCNLGKGGHEEKLG